MAILRKWLDQAGFDWEKGRLVLWPGQVGSGRGYGEDQVAAVETKDHPDLDKEFDEGFGAADCPAFVSFSGGFMFLASEYDGSTRLEKFPTTPEAYLEGAEAPCP